MTRVARERIDEAVKAIDNSGMVLQLQFWDEDSKTYVPAIGPATAEFARKASRAWRICDPARPRENPKYRPPRSGSQVHRSAYDIRMAYLRWARAAALEKVTAFSLYAYEAKGWGFLVETVIAKDYFAAPEELDG